MILRIVFDTNILYSAIRQAKGLPAKAVDLVTAGQVIPCVSDEVLEEYRDVLLREELDLHDRRRRRVLEVFSTLSLHVTPTTSLPPRHSHHTLEHFRGPGRQPDLRMRGCRSGRLHCHRKHQALQKALQSDQNYQRTPARRADRAPEVTPDSHAPRR